MLKGLRRFVRLDTSDRRLLLRSLGVVVGTRLALAIAGTRVARQVARLVTAGAGGGTSDRMEWAVLAASRRVPGATCLTQSLALQALLARAGHASRVEVGVSTEPGFQAHAWVVCGDRVMLSGPDVARYARILTLE